MRKSSKKVFVKFLIKHFMFFIGFMSMSLHPIQQYMVLTLDRITITDHLHHTDDYSHVDLNGSCNGS